MSKQEKLIEFIPLYLNGDLTDDEKKEFEDSLRSSPALQQELDDFKEIKEFYSEISKEIPEPSSSVLDRVLGNIDIEEKKRVQKLPVFSLEPAIGFFWRLFKIPAVSWGVAGVQFAIILFLVSNIPQDKKYETLSSPPVVSDGKITFNVVFKEGAMEHEIRDLLLGLGGQLVNGPSPVGSYTIAISSSVGGFEKTLDKFKKSPIVRFAAKAF